MLVLINKGFGRLVMPIHLQSGVSNSWGGGFDDGVCSVGGGGGGGDVCLGTLYFRAIFGVYFLDTHVSDKYLFEVKLQYERYSTVTYFTEKDIC